MKYVFLVDCLVVFWVFIIVYIIPSGSTSYLLQWYQNLLPYSPYNSPSISTFRLNLNLAFHHFNQMLLLEGHHTGFVMEQMVKKRRIDQLSFAYGIGCPYRWDRAPGIWEPDFRFRHMDSNSRWFWRIQLVLFSPWPFCQGPQTTIWRVLFHTVVL